MLAFAATSRIQVARYPVTAQYAFDLSPDSLLQRMYDLRTGYNPWVMPPGGIAGDGRDTVSLTVGLRAGDRDLLPVTITAELARTEDGWSVLRPFEVEVRNTTIDPEEALDLLEAQVIEPVRRNRPNEVHWESPPIGSRPELEPRILGPHELFSSRAEVRVFIAEPAHLALVEITPRLDWQVIYPVEPADERMHRAGEQVLTTLCARAEAREPVPPRDDVPPCAIARRMTLADARRFHGKEVPDRCPGGYDYPRERIFPGTLLLIAADAPLRRAALEETLGTWCQSHPMFAELSLARVLSRLGAERWAAADHMLRR